MATKTITPELDARTLIKANSVTMAGVGPFFVYELIDPRCGSVFYVGKGKGNRPAAHEKEARSGIHGRKCDRIRAIINEGQVPSVHIVEMFSDEMDAYAAEAAHINNIGLGNLTNICMGGRAGLTLPDIGAQARKWVKSNKHTIWKILAAHAVGIRVMYQDCDLVTLGMRSIEVLKERAGVEFFDGIVGRPEWRLA